MPLRALVALPWRAVRPHEVAAGQRVEHGLASRAGEADGQPGSGPEHVARTWELNVSLPSHFGHVKVEVMTRRVAPRCDNRRQLLSNQRRDGSARGDLGSDLFLLAWLLLRRR